MVDVLRDMLEGRAGDGVCSRRRVRILSGSCAGAAKGRMAANPALELLTDAQDCESGQRHVARTTANKREAQALRHSHMLQPHVTLTARQTKAIEPEPFA